jgi:hypothetical protein
MTVPSPNPECDLRYQRIPILVPPRPTSFKTGRSKQSPTKRNPTVCPSDGSDLPAHWPQNIFAPRTVDFFFLEDLFLPQRVFPSKEREDKTMRDVIEISIHGSTQLSEGYPNLVVLIHLTVTVQRRKTDYERTKTSVW